MLLVVYGGSQIVTLEQSNLLQLAEIGTTTENNPATQTNTNTELTEIISL